MSRRVKYFVIAEGSDRGILRNSLSAAEGKKKRMKEHHPGKKVYIFEAKRLKGLEENES